jgi:hypothetical protein
MVLCLLTMSGCTAKLPRTVAVSGPELEVVRERLNRFLDQSCVNFIDSDVRLEWQAYGRQETYPATLMAASPASLRFALVDPLGRPMLLLVINKNAFMLADNREGKGYTGSLDSEYIRTYLPDGISGESLFFWLSGRIQPLGMEVTSARRSEDNKLFWYELDYGDRLTHLVALDRHNLSRHMVLDRKGEIIFDVRYSEYAATSQECGWPGKIEVAGENLTADFSLEYTRMYSFAPLKEQLFQLHMPSHFAVHNVQ